MALSVFRTIDLDETEEAVKTSPGQIRGWFITNQASSTRYIKIYDATVAGTIVGTTVPKVTIPLEPDQAANIFFGDEGIQFDVAITIAATTGLADNDTGAPSANDVIANIFY